MNYYSQFRKHGDRFTKALDDFANWLNNNPPPGVDVEAIKIFRETINEMGEGFLAFAALVLLEREAEE